MKSLVSLFFILFICNTSQASTLSTSIGEQTWNLGGNILNESAKGFYTEGLIGFDKSGEKSLFDAHFSIKLSTVQFRPENESPIFSDKKNVNLHLLQWGPVLCTETLKSLHVCGSFGVVDGLLSQSNIINNSFYASYARIGVQTSFEHDVFLTLNYDLFKFNERQDQKEIRLNAEGLNFGIGKKF